MTETDNSADNDLSVQDLCNTLKREGVSEEDIDLVKLVLEEKEKGNAPPDSQRNVDHKTLKQHAAKVNGILKYIPTRDITDMNNLLLAAGRVVQMKVGMKRNENGKAKEPLWKRRLRSKMSGIRKDLGRVERWKRGELANVDLDYELERKYPVKKRGINVVIEELKQRMKAIQYKIKRYEDKTEQYKQNRMFETSQPITTPMQNGLQSWRKS